MKKLWKDVKRIFFLLSAEKQKAKFNFAMSWPLGSRQIGILL
jgi:hypothetical protein